MIPEKGYKVLKENAFTVSMTDVLAVEMKDTPGGLYEIVNTLGQNSVNVDYAYAFVTAKAQRAMLILRVDDIAKAGRCWARRTSRSRRKRRSRPSEGLESQSFIVRFYILLRV